MREAGRARPRRTLVRGGLALGVALFGALIAWRGAGDVAAALSVAGWGLLAVAAFHVVPLVLDALAWRALVPREVRPSAGEFVVGRWIGESVNSLLPVMQIGGSVARATRLARRGVPGDSSGASVVVDMTLLVATQVAFSLLGVGLLVARAGGERIARVAVAGAGLMGLMVAGFFVAQRRGVFGAAARLLEHLPAAGAPGAVGIAAGDLDGRVAEIYSDRRGLAVSAALHLASWIAGCGEVWLALRLLASPVGWVDALLLESLGQAVRAGAFAVPGALGIQEGGYVVLGAVVGLAPETCLALSLSKRARELLLGLPGLLTWQADVRPAKAGGRGPDRGKEGH